MASNRNEGSDGGAETTQQKWEIAEEFVLRPVTLKQVLNAQRQENLGSSSNPVFSINGRRFHTVRVVATIRIETINKLSVFLRLDDGTIDHNQPVIASYYPNDIEDYKPLLSQSSGILPCLRDVSLVGRIDSNDQAKTGRNFIRVDSLRPVIDPHETYYHALDVIRTELMYERGPPPGSIIKRSASKVDEPQDGGKEDEKGKKPEVVENDDEGDELKDHPANTPAPKRKISPPKVPRQSPHDTPPVSYAPHTPSRPSGSREPQSPTAPSDAMDSLSLNNATGVNTEEGSRSAPSETRTKKNKGKRVVVESVPESPTPGSSRHTPRATSARSSNNTKCSDTTSKSPTTSAGSAARSTRRPRLSMHDPLSHLSRLQRSVLLKIKEDAPTDSSNGVHIEAIIDYVIASHRHENIAPDDIIDALDVLRDAGHIEEIDSTLEIYRAKDSKGKRRVYEIPRE
ncbi:hypothetical protein BDY19DRAFT_918435 [Irpex rosettiformis]|uniref:Uncharacterized protein n=1 Tax=Irpex rosettiformis TaxID=378272 RepID=A0ACB8UHE8_9APHY|nr:hypothetical protein BDY19DRAFT_918435 [Irpex rosettiformis]